MSPTKVIIAGCGIAGPVLAVFLKSKGYSPVIYERNKRDLDATGLSLMLQPNGLRLLSILPGFDLSAIPSQTADEARFFSWMPEAQIPLASSTDFAAGLERFGFQPRGVERSELHKLLIEHALKSGIDIKWDQKLVAVTQGDGEVRVDLETRAGDKSSDTASFVVGCDGLHSGTRSALFGEHQADFTGCTQTGGMTLIKDLPKSRSKVTAMSTVYGNGSSMIMYPVSETKISWAITQHEAEERETWRGMDQEKQEQVKKGPHSEWGFDSEGIVANAQRMVKYGLYDRKELPNWHKDRVVLLGDAAHPTSPHLGQGANQAFEDIYHLVRLLVKHNPTASPLPTEKLSEIFEEYQILRKARTTALVRGARAMGELRSTSGVEACLARNEIVKNMYTDEAKLLGQMAFLFDAPFTGAPEI
ncbi:hypothetical protein HWV62_2862 [Athelia sp. TMB]|nr:hypothetical protein HWV62_2862 [Athelia sp. TMB]